MERFTHRIRESFQCGKREKYFLFLMVNVNMYLYSLLAYQDVRSAKMRSQPLALHCFDQRAHLFHEGILACSRVLDVKSEFFFFFFSFCF